MITKVEKHIMNEFFFAFIRHLRKKQIEQLLDEEKTLIIFFFLLARCT